MKTPVFLLFLLLVEIASAEIIMGPLDEVYSIGDEINLSFSIQKQKNSADYLECYLDCGSRLLVHKEYYLLDKVSKKSLWISFPASLDGKCFVEVSFDGEAKKSPEFEISEVINVDFSLNNQIFFPGETVFINGTAVKQNREQLNGFAHISVAGLENRTIEVKEGEFSLSFQIPSNALPGDYKLGIEAFEKNTEETIINHGYITKEFGVKSKPSSLSVISGESIKPPFNFSARIVLLDQADVEVGNESIIVKMFDSQGELVLQKDVESGKTFYYPFESNSLRGMWRLYATYGNIFSPKMIYVEDNQQVDFNVINKNGGSYLQITNIGNVNYTGNFQVSVVNTSFKEEISINLSLGIGERVFEPLLYDGVFNISAGEKEFQNVPLIPITGAAVSPVVKITWKSYLALFIIIVIVVIVYLLISKKKKLKVFKKEEKTAFMVFFKFDKYLKFEDIVEREGFSLSKISKNLYYILFYRHNKQNPELCAYSLAKKIRNRFFSRMHGVSIIINSGRFYDKEKFLKEFSLTSMKILEHASGEILVSEDILSKLKLKARKAITFRGKEKTFKMYQI